jgi:acyl-CoA thioesterase-1
VIRSGKTIVPVIDRVVAAGLVIVTLVGGCTPASTTQPTASSRATTQPTATTQSSPTASLVATPTPSPSPAANAVRYIAIGASDTVGVGASDPTKGSWPARIAALLPTGTTYVNLGVSGSLAAQAQREQLPGAIAQRPTVVTLWLAVNDLNATIEPASYQDALGAIVNGLVQGTSATVFVGNVPDLRGVPVYAGVDKTRLLAGITAYNDAIARIAAGSATRVFVVDLFTGSADLVSTATVSADGFHPSDAGYQLIADRFATAMRAKGFPLRS